MTFIEASKCLHQFIIKIKQYVMLHSNYAELQEQMKTNAALSQKVFDLSQKLIFYMCLFFLNIKLSYLL